MFKKISQNFVKSHLKFCLNLQILVHNLWHVCSLLKTERFQMILLCDVVFKVVL